MDPVQGGDLVASRGGQAVKPGTVQSQIAGEVPQRLPQPQLSHHR